MGRDSREQADELRAVAPLVLTGAAPQLVGPCTLVTNGTQTIAISSAELLREAGDTLGIALTPDGTRSIPVASWTMGRFSGVGILELGEPFPLGEALDVVPLSLGSVSAAVDTRGAPSGLVTVVATDRGLVRRLVPVHVDAYDASGMLDETMYLASPDHAADVGAVIDGAALFTWMPSDPVLGRKSEVVFVALACKYRSTTVKVRELPPIAELFGLEDIGRALPWSGPGESSNELGQVAGEIGNELSGPLAGLDLDDQD